MTEERRGPTAGPSRSPEENLQAILASPSYALAEEDLALLKRDELRPVRLQLELWKPELTLTEHAIRSTIVIFGGTRIVPRETAAERLRALEAQRREHPEDADLERRLAVARRVLAKSPHYDAARALSRLISERCQRPGRREFVVVTGGGPGVMEAANRGAFEAGAESIGLNIDIPREQVPNPFITPHLCFRFHYFAIRKMHFLLRAKGLVAFPGGFGTLDELFETLTLLQTRKIKSVPVVLFGREYWEGVLNLDYLMNEGMIEPEDLGLFRYAETPEEAWRIICAFHALDPEHPLGT